MIKLQAMNGAALLADLVTREDISFKRRIELGLLGLSDDFFQINSQVLHFLPKPERFFVHGDGVGLRALFDFIN